MPTIKHGVLKLQCVLQAHAQYGAETPDPGFGGGGGGSIDDGNDGDNDPPPPPDDTGSGSSCDPSSKYYNFQNCRSACSLASQEYFEANPGGWAENGEDYLEDNDAPGTNDPNTRTKFYSFDFYKNVVWSWASNETLYETYTGGHWTFTDITHNGVSISSGIALWQCNVLGWARTIHTPGNASATVNIRWQGELSFSCGLGDAGSTPVTKKVDGPFEAETNFYCQ